MENKIIDAARAVFIEKGYAETSMSEIAARVGINRPGLHYYFRTKDKMFQAVFGSIVSSVVPKVFEALVHKEKSVAERIEGIIDAYYALFLENPQLPMFMLRELNRDSDLLIHTVQELNVVDVARNALVSLQEEMDEGKLNRVPLQFIFYNFYGLLIIPFLTRDISTKVFENDEDGFKLKLSEWKQNIISQMEDLLEVKK
ncbi:MAG: TetR/AcrR family transcriptional regulator [Bacteroidaceae bacterium]|nr:TetR/AcrR family transcriptional regulator [Bacteroidaceae bacterium]